MPFPGSGSMPSPGLGGLASTRTIVRQGIASYFGGTYKDNIKAWQNGPLLSYGLITVKAGFGKRIDWRQMFNQLTPGRGMGCLMIVTLNRDQEVKDGTAGPPTTDGSGNITGGGIKLETYQCVLECFHMAQQQYAEDAQTDIDNLIEAIKQQLRQDRTLGQICTDAGMTKFGIRVAEDHPGVYGERTATHFTVSFEVRVQIVA